MVVNCWMKLKFALTSRARYFHVREHAARECWRKFELWLSTSVNHAPIAMFIKYRRRRLFFSECKFLPHLPLFPLLLPPLSMANPCRFILNPFRGLRSTERCRPKLSQRCPGWSIGAPA